MSIKLDWDLTDAPAGDEKHPSGPRASSPPPQPQTVKAPPVARWPLRWLPWAAVVVVLGIAGAVGAWLVTRSGWQRVTTEVTAVVRYEETEARQGHTALVMAVQDSSNSDWLALRTEQLGRQQPAPLPIPMLREMNQELSIGALEAVETDVVMAVIGRDFQAPDGKALRFRLPQFYRRNGSADWRRTAPPGAFWGQWLIWEGPHLVIRYSERDAAFVARAAPLLETHLAVACAGWQDACFNTPPARLYLSGFVGSIGYNPLNNVEVRIQSGTISALSDTYYLSVPSPQIAGIPQDSAGEKFLTDYLAVRLIASMAQHATRDVGAYQTLTAGAINTLGLGYADPGYVAAAHAERDGAPSGGNATSSTVPSAIGPDVYQVVAGDTLSRIATQFRTSVDAIVQANNISDPDRIPVGAWLTIPGNGR